MRLFNHVKEADFPPLGVQTSLSNILLLSRHISHAVYLDVWLLRGVAEHVHIRPLDILNVESVLVKMSFYKRSNILVSVYVHYISSGPYGVVEFTACYSKTGEHTTWHSLLMLEGPKGKFFFGTPVIARQYQHTREYCGKLHRRNQ